MLKKKVDLTGRRGSKAPHQGVTTSLREASLSSRPCLSREANLSHISPLHATPPARASRQYQNRAPGWQPITERGQRTGQCQPQTSLPGWQMVNTAATHLRRPGLFAGQHLSTARNWQSRRSMVLAHQLIQAQKATGHTPAAG